MSNSVEYAKQIQAHLGEVNSWDDLYERFCQRFLYLMQYQPADAIFPSLITYQAFIEARRALPNEKDVKVVEALMYDIIANQQDVLGITIIEATEDGTGFIDDRLLNFEPDASQKYH